MLYIFHGTDTATSSKKMIATIEKMQKSKPDASFFKVEDGKLTQDIVNELTASQGLFENKYIVELQYPFEKDDTKEVFLKNLKEIADSENVFLVLEGKILKSEKGKIEKVASKMFLNDEVAAVKKTPLNLFNLAEAFAKKNKKKSWVGLQRAFDQNISPEEIHGVLWWQFKSIYSTSIGSAKELGMKDFTYNKSKGLAGSYRKEDIEKIMNELIEMSHEAHLGERDFKLSLEKLALNI